MNALISGGKGLIGSAISRHLFGSCRSYDLPDCRPPAESYDAFIDCARYEHLCDQQAVWEIVIDHFKQHGSGRMILFSSIYGHKAPDFGMYIGTEIQPTTLEYAMWKGGTEQAVRYLAQRLKPYSIQVNAIAPGGVCDKHSEAFQEEYRTAYNVSMIETKHLLPVVDMLLSRDNRVNGQVISVDGGIL